MFKDRKPVMLTHNGKTQSIAGWGKETGLGHRTISARIKAGMTPAEAIETPKPDKKIADALKIKEALLKQGLKVLVNNPQILEQNMQKLLEEDFSSFIKLLTPFLQKEKPEEKGQKEISFVINPTKRVDPKEYKPLEGN